MQIRSNNDETKRKLEQLVTHGPSIDVVPSDLDGAYQTNSVAADDRYKDKVLRVTGMADRVGQDADGVPLVYMHDYHHDLEPSLIICAWHDRASAARIDRGPKIVVRGVGAGTSAGTPLLVMCNVE